TLKESGTWTAFYVAIALLFGLLVWGLWDQEHALQYYTGYVTEKALSVDNLFVFALIMGAFKIPRKYEQKVLLIGVVLALIFRLLVWGLWDQEHALQYYSGYVTEKALSVDNLFVFALIMGAFKIPRKYQQKVLLIGIVLALIFRLVFILLGAAVIAAWSDVF